MSLIIDTEGYETLYRWCIFLAISPCPTYEPVLFRKSKPTTQPVKSDSQPNDSNELILFSESQTHCSDSDSTVCTVCIGFTEKNRLVTFLCSWTVLHWSRWMLLRAAHDTQPFDLITLSLDSKLGKKYDFTVNNLATACGHNMQTTWKRHI